VTVIPNGIGPHPKCSAAEISSLRQELGIAENTFVVGSTGRLAPVKGYDRLLDAWAILLKVMPRKIDKHIALKLIIVGDGQERETLCRQARDLGIVDSVIFVGYRNDARKLLELMDVFVLPSRSEGLPLALLEAMAAERIVLVTAVGANRHVVDGGRAGIILPSDERSWTGILVECIVGGVRPAGRPDTRYRDMRRRAHQRATRSYSIDAMLTAYERVYAAVGGLNKTKASGVANCRGDYAGLNHGGVS
jgi:glycosyltransferase involved in cell wall biosynthesis